MQLIEVIPCGPLAKLYPSLKITATSAAEAIEGWSMQVGKGLRLPQIMEVLGFETETKLRAQTDAEQILVYPTMFGGGGKWTGIILGAALIAAAFIISPGLTSMVAVSLLVSGATMMAMGVINLLLPAPSLSREQDPEASKYIGAGQNTTKIGTPIGMGAGRIMLGGQFLSVQVNSSDLVYGEFPATPPA